MRNKIRETIKMHSSKKIIDLGAKFNAQLNAIHTKYKNIREDIAKRWFQEHDLYKATLIGSFHKWIDNQGE